MMLKCKEVARLLATDAAVDGALSDRLRVKLHLLFCRHCRGYARQLHAIGDASRGLWGGGECTEDEEGLRRLEGAILRDIAGPSGADPGNG